MVVLNAHKVTDSSQDGFAVRLFRTTNRTGFLRAFSDQPSSFAASFAKVSFVCLQGLIICSDLGASVIDYLYLSPAWPPIRWHRKGPRDISVKV